MPKNLQEASYLLDASLINKLMRGTMLYYKSKDGQIFDPYDLEQLDATTIKKLGIIAIDNDCDDHWGEWGILIQFFPLILLLHNYL